MTHDHPDDLLIRNRRSNRLIVPVLLFGLGCLWVTVCGLRINRLLDRLFRPEVDLYGLGIVSGGVLTLAYVLQPVRHWTLGETLAVWPERRYRPAEIREIAFAPDPAEDYDDATTPVLLCEVRARLRRRELRSIISVGDARLVRDWAICRGIAVNDPAGVLEPARHEP
jgi:hypothetical protein